MRLDEMPPGPIYVDTNVFYMYLRTDPRYLPIIRSFFERVIEGEVIAFVGVPVLDELFYRLLLARIRDQGFGNPLSALRRQTSELVRQHALPVEHAIVGLLNLPNVHLVGVEADDGYRLFQIAREYGLLPRDALHVAIMERLGLTAIASDDTDFDRVERLRRHWIANAA